MERLVIHLGLHKTGTTAVQQYLEANAAELLARGASYIPIEQMRQEVMDLFYETDDAKRESFKRLVESFSTHTLILSDENIAGGVEDIAAGTFYPIAREKLTAVVGPLTDLEIHLVLTLRNPVQLLPSLYAEYLRLFDFVDFETYVAGIDLSRLSHWDAFGWISELPDNFTSHVVPFEPELGGGVPMVASTILRAAFGTSLGFDLRRLLEKLRPSFSAEEIDLARTLASAGNVRTARLFLNMLDDNNARFGERRYAPIAGDIATVLTQRYEHDLKRFGITPVAPA